MAFIVTLFVSCEEYYKPDLEEVPGLLVVESRLTNDPKQNFVKLSTARGFYSTSPVDWIRVSSVELIEAYGQVIKASETDPGYYTFEYTPVPGKTYILRISYQDDVYESDPVLMPPLPTLDTLYANHKIEQSYQTDAYGKPQKIQIPGREIGIDAPITNGIQYYHFHWRAILQWTYSPPALNGPPPPSYYGWISRYDKDLFNIAGPKEFTVGDQVKNHPILSLAYNSQIYLDSIEKIAMGWILIVDQYGISKQSYNFHKYLNSQFSAEGNLFEPIVTQVYGNIHCKTDASKIALGFFDVNSYRQYRYFLNIGSNERSTVVQRRLNSYPHIPDRGYERGNPPEFWETNYKR